MQEGNLENDLAADRSVFRFYQALLIYTRTLNGERWAVICNFAEEQNIKLPFECGAPELSNLSRQQANGVYQPYECAVCRVLN